MAKLAAFPSAGFVYMAADGMGTLIYIGSTNDLHRRLLEHRRLSGWWPDIAWLAAAAVTSPDLALNFEAKLIADYRPRVNVRQPGARIGCLLPLPTDADEADILAIHDLQSQYLEFAGGLVREFRQSLAAFDALRVEEAETVRQCLDRLVARATIPQQLQDEALFELEAIA